jgi:uncharacterized protein (TIGR02646 family)
MQYIRKLDKEPTQWNKWFTVPPARRTFDYGVDYRSLNEIRLVKLHLINEQHHLCAYCQQKIEVDNSSIEHVTPKEHNKELSTSYFNLVAVCNKNQVKDYSTGKLHCDKSRGSELIPPIIFYSNSESNINNLNHYFSAYSDGSITAKNSLPTIIKQQVEAFIEILNLNHSSLKETRAKVYLRGLTDAYSTLAPGSHQKNLFWRSRYEQILINRSQPFREFLLLFIGPKIGLS